MKAAGISKNTVIKGRSYDVQDASRVVATACECVAPRLRGGLSAGILGAVASEAAGAETLADVPDRGPGADLERAQRTLPVCKLDRIPEATPGKRNVDPGDAINSKTPHQKLVGNITPTDLHYEGAAIPACPISIPPSTGC